jgi:hypothetical protein
MSQPKLPIKPAAHEFEDLFSIGKFHVPRYQRAYDWRDNEVEEFARDIGALVAARLDGSPARHFFGALITIHEQGSEFEIVDGQQRLTTHFLCLKELRDRWLALAEATRSSRRAMANRAIKQVERVEKSIFHGEDPRLFLSRRDREFFVDLINDVRMQEPSKKDPQSHRRLWEARETLREELFDDLGTGSGPFAKRQERLESVQEALLTDGYVVHLNSTEGDEAYRLFMVLNDRGKPLSAGDLLRTHTLAELEKYGPLQEAAELDWNAILEADESFVNRFLAAYYSSYTGARIPTGETYDKLRDRFFGQTVDSPSKAKAMREQVAKLRAEFALFVEISAGVWPYPEPRKSDWEQDRLKRLVKSLRHRLADPLLLATAREASESVFRDLVLMLEPVAFRYISIAGGSPAKLEGIYFRYAKSTRANSKLDKTGLRKELRRLIKRYARDETFEVQLEDQLRFNNRKAGIKELIKHFLTTLEDYEVWYQSGKPGQPKPSDKTRVFGLKTVNIEHIYPQNPKTQIPLLNPLKHTLGNLTALDQDEGVKAGNKGFPQKKPIYEASEFKITKTLADIPEWDQAAVADRVKFYIDRALKIFVV